MKNFLLMACLTLGFLGLSNALQAQNYEVKGKIVDSTKVGLPSATVVLLQASDSVMVTFNVSNNEGVFHLKNLKAGDYVLQISYMGYKNWAQSLSLSPEKPSLDLAEINLDANAQLLETINVEADKIPIVIKKDTIEYNADAFKVKPNSDVEALLKKLPGIEVEKDGTVKAQGEEVKKILVDGKEFFGDDPKTATKNLPADAVDKVQVLDRLSELSQFTGVDDGNREKTINLTLKEDKKNGTFGKLMAGGGTDERYRSKASINKFNKKMQLSFIGAANNINERNVSVRDYISFAGGIDALMQNGGNGGGFRSLMLGGNLFNNNQGINTNWTGGLNLNYDFSDKTEFHMSYLYNNLQNDLSSNRNRQNFGGRDLFITQSNELASSTNQTHTLRSRLKHKINDKQDLILRTNIGYSDRNGNNDETSQTFVGENVLSNEAFIRNSSIGEGLDINTSLLYRRKLGKEGRTLSLQADLGYGDNNQDNRLISENTLFSNLGNTTDLLNQLQNTNSDRFSYALSVNYTEPIGKKGLLQANYQRSFFRNEIARDFFDINDLNERLLDEELSTAFNTDYIYDKAGLSYVVNTKKSNLTWGIDLQNSNLDGQIVDNNLTINRDFFNLLPSFRWRYEIASGKSLRLNYSTSVNEPSLEQLQPILDNSNPLRLYQGNPDLKVAYQHSLRLGYYHFDQFSFTNIFANITARYTRNQITNATEIDEAFRQIVRPINVDNDLNITGFASFGMPIRPLKIKFDLRGNSTISRSILFINTQENAVQRYVNSLDLRLENRRKKVIDLSLGGRIAFNQTQYSENTELNQDFLTQTIYTSLDIDFLKRWHLNTTFDYDFYSGDVFQQNQEVPIWKAAISLNFLRFNKGELEFSVFDILNQNQGIQGNSQFNFIEEQRSNVLGRYFMLSFTYSISALGGADNRQ